VRRVRAEWTNGPSADNGAYGIYPVQCNNVLIEDSIAKGASDTGIYVGQSTNIIIRRNHVESNVAGIEIENSIGADVHDNLSTGNTGGILVFNLPNLQVQHGRRTRIYDNMVIANNTHNFAPAGNIVGGVPDGTGVMILANDQVEVFDNMFKDNNTSQITLISYNTAVLISGLSPPTDPNFDAFSESLYILTNTYDGGGTMPDDDLQVLVPLVGLPIPSVVIDGDVDPAKLVDGALPDDLRNCIEGDPSFVNLNIPGAFQISRDLTPYQCTHPRLPEVAIPGVQ
jgi:parallel beta-helix repeat protein